MPHSASRKVSAWQWQRRTLAGRQALTETAFAFHGCLCLAPVHNTYRSPFLSFFGFFPPLSCPLRPPPPPPTPPPPPSPLPGLREQVTQLAEALRRREVELAATRTERNSLHSALASPTTSPLSASFSVLARPSRRRPEYTDTPPRNDGERHVRWLRRRVSLSLFRRAGTRKHTHYGRAHAHHTHGGSYC